MRPVNETVKRIVMVPKNVTEEKTVMHNEVRTRMVAKQLSKTVLKKETFCKKVWKEVPVDVSNCAVPDCACQGKKGCNCPVKACNQPMFRRKQVDECTQREVPKHVHYTVMQPQAYTVQVPTTYMDYKTVMVPKEIEEVKLVQKPFEIEVPVEKVRHQVTRVPVTNPAENYYEHSHVGGDEEHRHGAAIDPSNVNGGKDDCALITCPDTLQPAWMAQDGQCYCGHGEEQTYQNVTQERPVAVGVRAQLAKEDLGAQVGYDRLYNSASPVWSASTGGL